MGSGSQRFFLLCFFLLATSSQAQRILSTGAFTGFTVPLTIDQGIAVDPRYQTRYDIKWAPIGLNVALDFENIGVLINPSLVTIGQNFYVANSVGGQVGLRKINVTYLQIPAGVKIKIIDLSFFRVNFTTALAAGFLLKGSEMIRHEQSKLTFPPAVEPILPPDYVVEYDGVIVPDIKDMEIVRTENYTRLQLFGSAGIRSDWDVSEKTRVSMDLRGNYGFFEPRAENFLQQIKNNQVIYDIYGKRREIFISFSLGVSRVMELERTKSRTKKVNYTPSKKKRRRQ